MGCSRVNSLQRSYLKWWIPQAVHWCHSQGFAHRFVGFAQLLSRLQLTMTLILSLLVVLVSCSLILVLLHRCFRLMTSDSVRNLRLRLSRKISSTRRNACFFRNGRQPGTLVPRNPEKSVNTASRQIGLGTMAYEMAYGVAPFFAPNIRSTYARIMNYVVCFPFHPRSTFLSIVRKVLDSTKMWLSPMSCNTF